MFAFDPKQHRQTAQPAHLAVFGVLDWPATFRTFWGLAMLARRVRTSMGAVAVTVLLIGVGSYAFVRHTRVQQAELKSEEDRRAAEAEVIRKVEEAGKQRLAAEQERQARAAAEAEAKRESEEVEQQRIAALKTAEEKGNRAEAEARSRYAALVSQGNADSKAGNYDKAIADYNEAVRLDSKNPLLAGATLIRTKATTTKPSPI